MVRKSVWVRAKLTSFIIRCTNWLWQDFSKPWTSQIRVFKVSVYQSSMWVLFWRAQVWCITVWLWKSPGNFLVHLLKTLSLVLILPGPLAALRVLTFNSTLMLSLLLNLLSCCEPALFMVSHQFSISACSLAGEFSKVWSSAPCSSLCALSLWAYFSSTHICTGISIRNSSQLRGPAEFPCSFKCSLSRMKLYQFSP